MVDEKTGVKLNNSVTEKFSDNQKNSLSIKTGEQAKVPLRENT
jgi:hypothetical protein